MTSPSGAIASSTSASRSLLLLLYTASNYFSAFCGPSSLATFDYKEHRAGDRAVVVGETPYFDPHSISRNEWLEATGR